jgi:hypothetical protein
MKRVGETVSLLWLAILFLYWQLYFLIVQKEILQPRSAAQACPDGIPNKALERSLPLTVFLARPVASIMG